MKVDTYIKEYEELTGEKVSEVARRFVECLLNIEAKFEEKGREDGAKRRPIPGADAFLHWANKVFDDDADSAASVADLMQAAYMHGYQEGGAE